MEELNCARHIHLGYKNIANKPCNYHQYYSKKLIQFKNKYRKI